jgi:DNA repair protein RecN (Recombination protein N)
MLQHLQIRNFALIEALELTFGSGLTTITGETGAGKSITFDALGLLLGDRATSELIRTGADEASVQGVFEVSGRTAEQVEAILQEVAVPAEGELVIRRTINRKGANRVFVNDTPVTVGLLSRMADLLVERIGQHAQLSLIRPGSHRELVDAYGGYRDDLRTMRELHGRWKQARAALQELNSMAAARAERVEFLRFQLRELEALGLRAGEYDELEKRVSRMKNLEKLRSSAGQASRMVYDDDRSASNLVSLALESLSRALVLDDSLAELHRRLGEASILLGEVGRDLSFWVSDIGDADDIDALQARHEQIRKAMRRHGCDEEGLITRFEDMKVELRRLENFEDSLEAAQREERKTFAVARTHAHHLEVLRMEAARRFFADVLHMLVSLSMPNTRMEWHVANDADLQPWGLGEGEILFSANPGQELAPLRKTASGGELSRLMLAFKTALVAMDPVDTYVFDEVDTGIGGATADIVGRMLCDLGRERQVLCITHQPQVACHGATHLHASKKVVGDRTSSSMASLQGEIRTTELARMLGGVAVTDATILHAREMLESARSWRETPT